MRDPRAWLAAAATLCALAAPGRAMGQGAIGIQPTVGTVPDGVGLSATPAVSADRRYVRLSIGFGSSTVQGFQNINFPAGAVGMGGGSLGGGGAGAGNGPSVLTGMNGPINPGAPPMPPAGLGYGYGSGFADFSGPRPDEVRPRRVTPRRSRADRAREERSRAVAAKARARPDGPK